jgi:hypothetical protein
MEEIERIKSENKLGNDLQGDYPTEVSRETNTPKNPWRPSIYTQELAMKICSRIAAGESVKTIGYDSEMPNASTIHAWVLEDKKEDRLNANEEGFSKKYARARDIQAEVMFDDILEIADDGTNDFMTITKGKESYNTEDREVTNRSRLRVDSRKWYLSKVLPKKFGDKMDVTSGGDKIQGNTIVFKSFKED